MTSEEVRDNLGLNKLSKADKSDKNTTWFVMPSCAITGDGLLEGLVRPLALSII